VFMGWVTPDGRFRVQEVEGSRIQGLMNR